MGKVNWGRGFIRMCILASVLLFIIPALMLGSNIKIYLSLPKVTPEQRLAVSQSLSAQDSLLYKGWSDVSFLMPWASFEERAEYERKREEFENSLSAKGIKRRNFISEKNNREREIKRSLDAISNSAFEMFLIICIPWLIYGTSKFVFVPITKWVFNGFGN